MTRETTSLTYDEFQLDLHEIRSYLLDHTNVTA